MTLNATISWTLQRAQVSRPPLLTTEKLVPSPAARAVAAWAALPLNIACRAGTSAERRGAVPIAARGSGAILSRHMARGVGIKKVLDRRALVGGGSGGGISRGSDGHSGKQSGEYDEALHFWLWRVTNMSWSKLDFRETSFLEASSCWWMICEQRRRTISMWTDDCSSEGAYQTG